MTDAPQPAPVDLTNCDREPIHIPGSIQPHGALLAMVEPALQIVQASANTEALLGRPPEALLGQPLGALLAPADIELLRRDILPRLAEATPRYLPAMQVGGAWFEPTVHRYDGLLILELEQQPAVRQAPTDIYTATRDILAALNAAPDLRSFCQIAAEQVRAFTGFDRVMIYRFREDDSGAVLAEAYRPDLESFLGLHYPASDIPRQARALYLKSWLRMKPDNDAQPVPLVPQINPATGAPLDLSHTTIRSMSPIHSEYLRNMGVRSTMSISIIHDGRLWGLVACHHYAGPKYIAHEPRAACELLAHMISVQIKAKQDAEQHGYMLQLASVQAQLVAQMAEAEHYRLGLTQGQPNLLGWIEAGGVAVCADGAVERLGYTPSEAQIQALVRWLISLDGDPVFATHALPARYPPAQAFADVASGLMAVRLSAYQPEYILWFRPEYRHTVSWAGDPTKPVAVGPLGTRLTPRTSFALWQQEVAGTSAPWQPFEREAAGQLRRAILELVIRRTSELAQLNAELERSNQELDSFAYIASHDLKEPLRGIHNYSHFLLEDYSDKIDEEGQQKLNTLIRLTQRMETLIDSLLHYSRVGRLDLAFAMVDLNQELEEIVLLLGQRIRERGAEIQIPRPLPTIYADRARVGEVFSNLISNAIKYNDKEIPIVRVDARRVTLRDESGAPAEGYIFSVSDNGIGIAENHHEAIFRIFKRLHGRGEYGGGVGAGLTIARKIIERHGGKIWITSQPGGGTTFSFTLGPGTIDDQQTP
ncbi:GAF domain-containing protein [Chloroflexia bacterium SDU3-3]|nr:GAF domain-containing protein [Chloroflexia bacterium SDU3-3]